MMKTLLTYVFYSVVLLSSFLFMTEIALSSNAILVNDLSEIVATKHPDIDTYITSDDIRKTSGMEEWFLVGHDQRNGNGIEHSLLQFDLSDVKSGSTIDAATISLKLELITPSDEPMTVTMYRFTGDWNNEDISWEEFDGNFEIDRGVSATQTVGTEFTLYHWNVKTLIEAWLNDPARTSKFSVILESNQTSGQHERGFWSRDCTDSGCEKPVLSIQTTDPTPTSTPEPTATNTPVPTPTATFTPVRVVLNLTATKVVPSATVTATPTEIVTAEPGTTPMPTPTPTSTLIPTEPARSDVHVGEHIIYTIDYMVTHPIKDVQLTNQLPAYTTPVSQGGGELIDDSLVWDLGTPELGTSSISYTVHYAPSAPAQLDISTGAAPSTVPAGTKIIMTAGLTPKNANQQTYYWDFGDGEKKSSRGAIQLDHTYDTAGVYTVIVIVDITDDTFNCSLKATKVITITEGMVTQATVGEPITRTSPLAETTPLPPCAQQSAIINTGAIMTWTIDDGSNKTDTLRSNIAILNPAEILYMPMIRK